MMINYAILPFNLFYLNTNQYTKNNILNPRIMSMTRTVEERKNK